MSGEKDSRAELAEAELELKQSLRLRRGAYIELAVTFAAACFVVAVSLSLESLFIKVIFGLILSLCLPNLVVVAAKAGKCVHQNQRKVAELSGRQQA